jgi:tetratricopeptide (TPR) repeat protein
MSLNNIDQKSMLFGNTPMNKEDKKPTHSLTHSTTKTPPTTTKKHTHLSSAMCAKKIIEGKEYHEKALKHLKTSLFQWSADHVAAAATFEAAGNCYNAAGELEKAKELYLLASESHDNAGAAAASAQALLKASKATKVRSSV